MDDFVGVDCTHCDELFRRKDLAEHEKICPKNRNSPGDDLPDETESSDRFRCQSCDFRINDADEFQLHVALEHNRQKLIENWSLENGLKCKMCRKDFHTQDALLFHLVDRHRISPASSKVRKQNFYRKVFLMNYKLKLNFAYNLNYLELF